jgi:hypothetical protein
MGWVRTLDRIGTCLVANPANIWSRWVHLLLFFFLPFSSLFVLKEGLGGYPSILGGWGGGLEPP